MHLEIFLSLSIAFTIVYFIIPRIIKVSLAKKLFDVPNNRSAAKKVVPTLGGIAVLAGFFISLIVASDSYNVNELKYMLVAIFVMFIVGLKDDIIGLSAKKKFVVQLAVALYLVLLGNYRITDLHGIFGINEIGIATGNLLSLLLIVGVINALNLIDGIDGLASGICMLISVVYGVWFLYAGDIIYALVCFSLAGSLLAFFLYNVFGTTNKIFMGDTGSLILGTIVALLTIRFNEFNPVSGLAVHGAPAIAFAIISVPVIDTIRVFAIRLSQKKSPFAPDMNHIHHHLLRLTNSHLVSSLILIAANGLLILLAFVLFESLGNNLLFVLLLILGFTLAGIPSFLVKYQGKGIEKAERPKSIFAFFLFHKK
ncbi:MAG: undecaprenyl/decaprenyl-phosphate alpha-N-acetylglucosaminyl 1-phosphate transferase [Prolixibacteraceae bacterium]|nr:undecaprenyl/decaprenyl-phosphate alpha-N-acetylglucosaminyl 1-phosphate transferase [Prolixibacteraceae bacterium]